MKRFARILFAGLGIVIAGSAISLVPHKPATAGGMTAVTVTNVPLPVTQSGPWNVGITGTPSVNANITNQVPVTGTVNANVSFPANQGVTVAAAGPLTNVGRLPSKQVELYAVGPAWCPSLWTQAFPDGSIGAPNSSGCFDMANHPGEVFVITDFSWLATTNPGATCFLRIANFTSGAAGASDGFAVKSEHLTTGMLLTVNPNASTAIYQNLPPCTLQDMRITGYLMPNQ